MLKYSHINYLHMKCFDVNLIKVRKFVMQLRKKININEEIEIG